MAGTSWSASGEWRAAASRLLRIPAELAEATDGLDLGVDGFELVAALALRDRLDARIADAIARVDAAELWDADAATSMVAWFARSGWHDSTRGLGVRVTGEANGSASGDE